MKTNIKITEDNREKIAIQIVLAESRASARTATANDLFESIKEIESRLSSLNVPKNKWSGMLFRICPEAQKFPNAYRWNPEATVFEVMRTGSGWTLKIVHRDWCPTQKILFRNECDYRQFFKF
jgi:hypothetical protein